MTPQTQQQKFDFLSSARYVTSISLLLSVFALGWILINGLNYGIDFIGGNEIQVRFQNPPKIKDLRTYLAQKSFTKASVQTFGDAKNEFLIFIENKSEHKTEALSIDDLVKSFKTHFAKQGVEIRKVNSVGPQIGSELKKKGLLAILYSLIMILIYLSIRFNYIFAPAAVICLFHDAILTMWIFSFFDIIVSVQTLAALLTIIGYSLNDTIVTFDRIRENEKYFGKKESFFNLCNRSINNVLSRTILTSFTTLMAVVIMWFYTDGVIKDFAFTLGVGVIIGTYSSIYIATPLVIFIDYLQKIKKNKIS